MQHRSCNFCTANVHQILHGSLPEILTLQWIILTVAYCGKCNSMYTVDRQWCHSWCFLEKYEAPTVLYVKLQSGQGRTGGYLCSDVSFWWLLWYHWRSKVSKMYYLWEGRRFIHMTLHTSWLSEPPDSECIIYCSWHGCKELEIFSERHSNWKKYADTLDGYRIFCNQTSAHRSYQCEISKVSIKWLKLRIYGFHIKNLNIKAEKLAHHTQCSGVLLNFKKRSLCPGLTKTHYCIPTKPNLLLNSPCVNQYLFSECMFIQVWIDFHFTRILDQWGVKVITG